MYMTHSENSTCFGVALDNVNENALDAGCIPPRWGHWTADDPIPEWSVSSVRELIHQYLVDGTCTCYCEMYDET
jgi:hypothetical protein